jgi:glucose-6-phosphate isomerase
MLNKKDFFRNLHSKNKRFSQNLKKTKEIYKIFKIDLDNFKIPLIQSYEKGYDFNFSKNIVKKFSKYKNIIVIGMGGSILGTKAIYSKLGKSSNKKLFFFDNLDPYLYLKFKKIKNLKNSCLVVISKSGNTLETIANLSVILSNHLFKDKLIFITEIKNSGLMNLAKKYKAEIIEHKKFIGGRYSVLSEVGMFPAALMGLNIKKFQDLKKLLKNKKFTSALIYNVAGIYTLNQKGIKSSVFLNYDSQLNDFTFWYQQLLAESLGKKGKGITPIVSFAPKDHHSTLQLFLEGPKDKFFTFFNSTNKAKQYKVSQHKNLNNFKFLKNKSLDNLINAQMKGTKNVFESKKIPFRQIIFKNNNENELGMIFTFCVLETILLARLMKINPFDQPAVELIKEETMKILLR